LQMRLQRFLDMRRSSSGLQGPTSPSVPKPQHVKRCVPFRRWRLPRLLILLTSD
jgi:hypothetical protein